MQSEQPATVDVHVEVASANGDEATAPTDPVIVSITP
jgi:hypothetical protein